MNYPVPNGTHLHLDDRITIGYFRDYKKVHEIDLGLHISEFTNKLFERMVAIPEEVDKWKALGDLSTVCRDDDISNKETSKIGIKNLLDRKVEKYPFEYLTTPWSWHSEFQVAKMVQQSIEEYLVEVVRPHVKLNLFVTGKMASNTQLVQALRTQLKVQVYRNVKPLSTDFTMGPLTPVSVKFIQDNIRTNQKMYLYIDKDRALWISNVSFPQKNYFDQYWFETVPVLVKRTRWEEFFEGYNNDNEQYLFTKHSKFLTMSKYITADFYTWTWSLNKDNPLYHLFDAVAAYPARHIRSEIDSINKVYFGGVLTYQDGQFYDVDLSGSTL